MRKSLKKIKKVKNKLPLFITALFVLGMLLTTWQPSLTGHVTAASCSDEDGDNQLVTGRTVVNLANGDSQDFIDKCTDGKLTEYICNGNTASEKLYDCACTEGYCSANPEVVQEAPRRRS